MKKAKKKIFQIFLVPLVLILLVQTLISYGTIAAGGTISKLNQYAAGRLEQVVETRKIIFENTILQQWSNVYEEYDRANRQLELTLKENDITIDEFLENESLQKDFLKNLFREWRYMLRKASVNGVFIALMPQNIAKTGGELNGIYLRDMDPLGNPADYSDIFMVRGAPEFSKNFEVSLTSFWKPRFAVLPDGGRKEDDFLYRPYSEALKNPDYGAFNLGYWSRMFCLEGNDKEDSYRMITYSLPLITEDGRVYGIMGIDISENYLRKMLPFIELNNEQNGGYLLLEKTEDNGFLPILSAGTIAKKAEELSEKIYLKDTKYSGLYELLGIKIAENKVFGAAELLELYNSNTPFANREWYLMGIEDQEDLFGIADKMFQIFIIATVLALIVGIIGVYFIVRHVTRPIRSLSNWIQSIGGEELPEFKESNIIEVDELHDVISQLNKKQKKTAYELREEKERYRLALQSSSDVLVTYDPKLDRADFMNLSGKNKNYILNNFWKQLQEGDYVYKDDRRILMALLYDMNQEIEVTFRCKIFKLEQYEWYTLRGKGIQDHNGNLIKFIGSLSNIHDQKVNDLKKIESLHRDQTTKLFKKDSGEAIIQVSVESQHKGYLIFVDIRNFLFLNEQYGMAVGDAILEELGHILIEMRKEYGNAKKDLVALRLGGDEFLIWLESFSYKETQEFLIKVTSQADELYQNMDVSIGLSIGISNQAQGDYDELLRQAKEAVIYAKMFSGTKIVFYNEMPEGVSFAEQIKEVESEIARTSASRLNMSSLTLTFFDRSHNIRSVLAILLLKLGRVYEADDIIMVSMDWDFYAVYPIYQWHKNKKDEIPQKTKSIPRDIFLKCAAGIQNSQKPYKEFSQLDGLYKNMFFVPEERTGIVIPLFDNGKFVGAMLYAKKSNINWSADTIAEMQEIAKIIETNINRERYDLASRAKSDFLSSMSHEIRTPMNAIIGMTMLAMENSTNPDLIRDYLQKIDQSSKYLMGLINDVLDMSKIESGKMTIENMEFNLSKLMQGIQDLIAPQMKTKGIHFLMELEIIHPFVYGDQLHLNQVLLNLLSNALKFTPINGTVTVTVQQEDTDEVYFSVKDNGIGIGKENQERIFSSFEQAEESTTRKYGGTGLGLAISSRLIHMMGSTIELDSVEGKGSDFYFVLDLPRGKEEEKENNKLEPVLFEGMKVLLVEDNELNAEIAESILEMRGFSVEIAENGKEAVEHFRQSEIDYYDLILMDIRMPVMDGLEATKRIRHMKRVDATTVPIIAMTANAFDEDTKKSIESGMDGHLSKPIDIKVFLKTLQEVLGKKTYK